MNNNIGAEGAKAIGRALAANQSLTFLEYAIACPFPYRQGPLTPLYPPTCSLVDNSLGAEGAKYISNSLAVNKTVKKLKYAACRPFPTVRAR